MSLLMLARDDEAGAALERAHHLYVARDETLRAARSATFIGINLAYRGLIGPATGWLARAQRILESWPDQAAEHGLLMLPLIFQNEAAGDFEQAAAVAHEAAEIGERFGDRDLVAMARHAEGHMLVKAGRVREGLPLLDESMVIATTQDLWPFVDRHRLLRRHPGLLGRVRSRSGAPMDPSADRLEGTATGARGIHRALSRAPGGDPPARRLVGGRARGGAARRETVRRDEEPGGGHCLLPASGAPPAQGRLPRLRGGLPRSEPRRVGASARARAAPARPRQGRGGTRSDPPRDRRAQRTAETSCATPRAHRDRSRCG